MSRIPSPLVIKENEDALVATKMYADHISSLISSYKSIQELEDNDQVALDALAQKAVDECESQLTRTQRAIDEALKAKDLGRMRELSTIKTTLYDRQKRLASAAKKWRSQSSPKVPLEELASDVGGKRNRPRAISKSAITLAAEAKEAARRQAKVSQPPVAPTASAARIAARSAIPWWRRKPQIWMLSGAVALFVLSAGVFGYRKYMAQNEGEEIAEDAPASGAAPQMQFVVLEQNPVGITARPKLDKIPTQAVSFVVKWFINGKLVAGERTARITRDKYQVGDKVEVEVIPQSQTGGAGRPMRSQALIVADLSRKRRQPTPAPGGAGTPAGMQPQNPGAASPYPPAGGTRPPGMPAPGNAPPPPQ